MLGSPEDKRLRKVAPMVWEILGTFKKTRDGLRDVERQRTYLFQHTHSRWPKFDDDRLTVQWKGRSCEFTPRQRSQHALLKLLAGAKGGWVEYTRIEDECMGGEIASSTTIRRFKFRLAETLRENELGDLAKAIESNGEAMRLKL
jgi:hypothetical protein